ncbi:MAG: DUF177 domain-containing protein [Thermoanaerobaculia bacterium]|nr:MAG: DUF177 domain-containing protein [Thermoanaerobaculia bacterium]
MKIRLDAARAEPFRWQESIDLSRAELGDDVEVSPVAVRGTLTWAAPNFLLQARLAYRQTVPCDRCLAPVASEMDLPVEWLVERRKAAPDGEERELLEEELDAVEVVGDELDSAPLVAEQVQLNLPTHPLCREDCAGLCPSCGRDRNRGRCECPGSEPDPRWSALATLRTKFDGRHGSGREES